MNRIALRDALRWHRVIRRAVGDERLLMLGNLGLPEVLLLAVVGLLVFGPDRLPKAVADAGRLLRQLRRLARGAINDVKAELGPELADVDIASLHPRRIVSEHIFGED